MESIGSTRLFLFLYCLSCLSALTIVVLLGVWLVSFRGGFAWQSDIAHEFNWHPLLMTLGLIVLYGNGMVVYRLMRYQRKKKLKLIHASMMILAFIFAVIGLKAVFDSHNLKDPPVPNLYSLHSWVGITAVILFSMQWIFGFTSFLFPGVTQPLRVAYLPIHVYFGVAIFILATAASLMGLLEKAIFSLKDNYSTSSEGILMNCIGMMIVIFGFLTTMLVTKPQWRRQVVPEDELLLGDRLSE
ncbi:transmembrane ascorbate-dependent reductase CYB561-like isoform X2 [Artemia franciscana]